MVEILSQGTHELYKFFNIQLPKELDINKIRISCSDDFTDSELIAFLKGDIEIIDLIHEDKLLAKDDS